MEPQAQAAALTALSLQEKLAFFYCSYVREEVVDPETDADAMRRWEKISVSRRKSRERVCWLLNQIENASASHVRHLDTTYRAKRELILLAEGTIGLHTMRAALSSAAAQSLTQLEVSRVANELLHECGALSVFTQQLLLALDAFRTVNLMDFDQVDVLIKDLHRAMVLLYLLLVFNVNKQNSVFDRQLFALGTSAPTYALVTILDGLCQLNVIPGFPTKRLLLLSYEWLQAILGSVDSLRAIKRLRLARNTTDQSVMEDEAAGLQPCKSFKSYYDRVQLDPQDQYYLEKQKFAQLREKLHEKYRHRMHCELPSRASNEQELATASLDALDDEWEDRCEIIYQLLMPRMRDLTAFFGNLVTLSCGSALNARDKKTFYSRRPSSTENYGMSDFSPHPMMESNNDNQFWKWILREKSIVLDVSNLLILLMFKHFRASHFCKGEYFMQFFLEANLLVTFTKFMNKDLVTYLQVSRQDADDNTKTGFFGLEYELDKQNIRMEDEVTDFGIQGTRTITTILRILQKLTKRKPNIIKNALCRSSSIVWLKRVVSLQIPLPRLYALKLVKSQAKYLGHQWVRKYTCIGILTDVYLYVRSELDDDWLCYEDEDLNKPPSQDGVERLIFGEMQAYHHKYYWDSAFSNRALPNGASLICEARKELDMDAFDVEGGRLAKFYKELKLEPIQFCQQYEKWLDQEKLTLDPHANAAPLPISFN